MTAFAQCYGHAVGTKRTTDCHAAMPVSSARPALGVVTRDPVSASLLNGIAARSEGEKQRPN